MKAILIYWLLSADGTGVVIMEDQPTVAACYAEIGAGVLRGEKLDPRARIECRPLTDSAAILGELTARRCKHVEARDTKTTVALVCGLPE